LSGEQAGFAPSTMSLFFSDSERRDFETSRHTHPGVGLLWAMRERVARRAASPSLLDREATVDWWHCVAEYLTDGAFMMAAAPEAAIGAWLRHSALGIARLEPQAWVGPAFRDHSLNPPVGNLETSHLSWSLAATLDLAPHVFSESEQGEIITALRDHAIPQCRRWLENNTIVANWRCVLTAGLAVPAAVLDDRVAMAEAVGHYKIAVQAFQSDGSYGESLQYANYAAFHLMLAWEALVRRQPGLAGELPLLPHSRFVRWAACSHFYSKPMGGGWGSLDRPRAANFADSAAIFRPTADVLLHIASRTAALEPDLAGLARSLFDTHYTGNPRQGPFDRATFGFVNHFGFLALPLLTRAPAPRDPVAVGLSTLEAFGNGDVLVRDRWEGRTVVALRTGGTEPLACSGHLHGDINSFILVHNRERLLVDPGHSCYRGLIHEIEIGSRSHSTCTFARGAAGFGLQEQGRGEVLQQSSPAKRLLDEQRQPRPPVPRATRTLLCAEKGGVKVVASAAAGAYGPEVREFNRVWLLAGSHVLFVVDFIATVEPLRTTWHWVLNNRDRASDLRLLPPDRFIFRRGAVGLKLFHVGPGRNTSVAQGFMHDAYHPKPAELGEGGTGSATIVNFTEPAPASDRCAIHALAFDDAGLVIGWHLKTENGSVNLKNSRESWTLSVVPGQRVLQLQDGTGARWTVDGSRTDSWSLVQA